jgi:putative glutathione S-transferase
MACKPLNEQHNTQGSAMGQLVDGVWQQDGLRTKDGHFIRPTPRFRNWVTPDGSPGPSGHGGFAAASGRYHLYVALSCPWAHRTILYRKLKGLENVISMSTVSPDMLQDGWTFNQDEGSSGDDINGKNKLYLLADPKYTGRVSVPVLWDKKQNTIVSNESPEIIRMLNSAFDAFTNVHTDYYPENSRADIDRINELVYVNINNGVYRSGFATSQAAYELAFRGVFDTLDTIEQMLSEHRYLIGNAITEADWRLFCTLIRFDAVYYSHFKCNWRHIYEYPNLSNYVRDLYQVPGVAETVSLQQIKRHYYGSQRHVNPTGIVPVGPQLDFAAPHDRAKFG